MQTIKKAAAIFAGNLLICFCVAAFVEPTGIISGGSAGIGLAVRAAFGVPISVTYAAINISLFFVGLLVLGKKFAATTLVSTLLGPVLLRFWEGIPALATLTDDTLLCAILAGVLTGAGVGLVMQAGSSTGGMDIPPLVANKYTGVSVGSFILFQNVFILALQVPFSGSEQILYGLVATVLSALAVDWVVLARKRQAQLLIISPQSEAIREKLLFESDVGLSMLPIETGYSQLKQRAVLCAVPTRRVPKVEALVQEIDPDSFVLVSSVSEIRGRGFTLPR